MLYVCVRGEACEALSKWDVCAHATMSLHSVGTLYPTWNTEHTRNLHDARALTLYKEYSMYKGKHS